MPLDKSTCMSARLALREQESFIIDTIFPAGAVHLIGGNSGVGKTTFLLRMMYEWEQGSKFLDRYQCNVQPWVYIAADRHRLDTDRTLRRIGLGEWDLPLFSVEDTLRRSKTGRLSEDPALDIIFAQFPDTKLFVIEGFQSFIPDTPKGRSQNKHEQVWMSQVRDQLLSSGRTIIGTTHAPKASNERASSDPRAGFLGSQSLIGACSTMVSIEAPEPNKYKRRMGTPADQTMDRVVKFLGRDYPDHVALYTRGDDGALLLDGLSVLSRDNTDTTVFENENDLDLRMHVYLAAQPRGQEMKLDLFAKWAKVVGMTDRALGRWIDVQLEQGVLIKPVRGRYERPREN